MAHRYECLKPFPWRGNEYVKGLIYTGYAGPVHEAFRAMAEDAVKAGKFKRLEHSAPDDATPSMAALSKPAA